MKADDTVVVFLEDRDWRLTLCAREVVTDVEIEADVLAEFEDGVRLVERGIVVGVVVKADPDFVLIREGRELLRLAFIALSGDAGAAERFRHEEIEIDLLVGWPEGNFVEVNVDPGVVVHLTQFAAFG